MFILEKCTVKNQLIKELEFKLEKGNIHAIGTFLIELEKIGTPLIEKVDNENSMVTFIYDSNEEVENIVFFSGFLSPPEEANLEEHKMEQIKHTNLWHITYKVRNDIRFMYYFFPNDSLKNQCDKRWDNMKWDKLNKNRLVWREENKEERIYSFCSMPNSEEDFWAREWKNVPKGSVHEHEFHSKNFKETRKIYVYTPYGYSKEADPYGYIVLTDAYDYINILSSMHTLDNLISQNKIKPTVAILIESTEERYEELTCNDKFCETVVSELIPWARERYNISTNPQEAIIGGTSLGGLTAAYLGLNHPEVFGNVLSKSGSFWYGPEGHGEKECWMSSKFREIDKLPLKVYLNVGILEHSCMRDTNACVRDALVEKGYPVTYETFKSGHDYLCWGETFANAMISLVGIDE